MADGAKKVIEDKTGGRMGRLQWHDPQNRRFPVRGVLVGDDAPIKTRTWWSRSVFDQGYTSSCAAQAAAGILLSSPARKTLAKSNLTSYDDHAERVDLYENAQKVDPWPGDNYDGTSTDAPFRVLRDRGHIAEWRWCFGLDDVLRTLSNWGPVAIGIVWRTSMMNTDARGFIRWRGDEEGGHAVRLLANNAKSQYVIGVNSWGASWGVNGRFKMTWPDLDAALRADGEAATLVV